jgi:hypothetical protein
MSILMAAIEVIPVQLGQGIHLFDRSQGAPGNLNRTASSMVRAA